MDYKDIAIRSIKTFVFAFIAVLVVSQDPTSKAAITAALAAAIGAVFNTSNQLKNNR